MIKKFAKEKIGFIAIAIFIALSLMAGIAAAGPRGNAVAVDRKGETPVNSDGVVVVVDNKGETPDDVVILPTPYDDIVPENYVTVSGVVKDKDGNPVQKIWVNASTDVRMMEGYADYSKPYYIGGGTNEKGEFSISVPKDYTYDLYADTYGFTEAGLIGGYFQDADGGSGADPGADKLWSGTTVNDWSSRTVINVGAEGVSGIAITLKPAVKIYGKVIDAEGNPVKEIWIDAQAYYEYSEYAVGWAGDSSDEAGNFTIMAFPGAKYRLSSWPWKSGFLGGYWKSGDDSNLTASGKDGALTPLWDDSTLIDTSSDVEINIILDKGNSISGRVTDESGDPIANIWVEVYSDSNSDCVPPPDGKYEERCVPVQFGMGASTDNNGYYKISVYPGSGYRVSTSGNGMYKTVYYNDTPYWEEATLIDTTKGSVADINFVLTMGPGISGVISGLDKDDVVTLETWSYSRGNWENTTMTGTGSDVSFKIRGLNESDDYVINVWADGYLSGCLQKDGSFGNCYDKCYYYDYYDPAGTPCSESNVALFKVGATDVKIKMDRGRKISGTITGLSKGDSVWVSAYSDQAGSKGGTNVTAEGETADFAISGLGIASDFRISVDAKGYVTGYYSGSDALVSLNNAKLVSTKDGDVSGIKIAMSTGNSISGVIKGLDNGVYAWVSAWSETSGSRGEAGVIGNGSDAPYEIKCLGPASDYRVYVQADGYIASYYSPDGVSDWEHAGLVDVSSNPANIDLTLSKGKSISGTITGLKEREWATIEAYRKNNDWIEPILVKPGYPSDVMRFEWGGNNWGMASVVGTREPVTYTINCLASANDFVVIFRSAGYASQMISNVDSSTNPANIDFTASEGKRISGKIAGANPNKPVWISAWSENSWDSGYAEVVADADGNAAYEIKGLGNAADYVVNAWSERDNLYYNQSLSWDKAAKVDISKESAVNIDFDFNAIEKYLLSGTIAGVTDDTIVWIDAWSKNSGGWGNAEVKGNGKFSIKLPVGDYTVGIYANGYVAAYYDSVSGKLVYDWASVNPVSLTADKDLGALTMFAGYSISGAVTDSQGNTVIGAWIDVSGSNAGNGAQTGKDGTYSVSGLPDGTYNVNVWSSDGNYRGTVDIKGADAAFNITLNENKGSDIIWNGGRVPVAPVADEAALKDGSNIMIVVLFDSNGDFVNSVETDATGNYSFGELAPGEYTVKREKDDGSLEFLDTLKVAE